VLKPDYNNSIMNITNSVLKYYGAEAHHATLPLVDKLLAKNYKNVVFLLMDGMGVNVLERNLPEDAFLRKHSKSEISSVFPPTTTAATTSVLTGKTPAEHGWIGWSCYFKEVDKCVDLYSNCESGTDKAASAENQPYKYLGYKNIINALGNKVRACMVSPFSNYYADTMEGICEHLKTLCEEEGRKFIYAYHYQPDHDMHEFGVSPRCINEMMADYSKQLEALANSLSDTLLLISADHGMVDIAMECVEDYPQIKDALLHHICVEPRCCSLYVKPSHMAVFPKLFSDAFGDKFILLTHDAFLQSGLLGGGMRHPKTDDFVGDFMAIAVSDIALWYKDIGGGLDDFKGAHAGLTKEELAVPLIVIEK
jgi:Uncharacterized proteins of the AP superfamily